MPKARKAKIVKKINKKKAVKKSARKAVKKAKVVKNFTSADLRM